MDHVEAKNQGDLRVVAGGGSGESWVVVDKPAGLLSTPGKGAEHDPKLADCVAARVHAMFPDAQGPLIAHRLDMDTSGLMVLGLTAAAQRALSMQFEGRHVEKRYVALVEGHALAPGETGAIVLPMRLDIDNRPRQIVDVVHGRHAITRYCAVAREALVTDGGTQKVMRVVFEPVTGRSHQLRVHAAQACGLGAPIVGDAMYGTGKRDRLMLHAQRLCFDSPDSGARVEALSEAEF
ncbi:MAG: RluA family pseudouridine synthase [Phycisphaerales bacterium]|nr:RluA family pseudouridine synthase [Phycisphaerales bacterium]